MSRSPNLLSPSLIVTHRASDASHGDSASSGDAIHAFSRIVLLGFPLDRPILNQIEIAATHQGPWKRGQGVPPAGGTHTLRTSRILQQAYACGGQRFDIADG